MRLMSVLPGLGRPPSAPFDSFLTPFLFSHPTPLAVTASRMKNQGKGMTAEWDKNMAFKRKAKADEDERVRKIGEYNAKKLKEMAAQDEAAKEKKRQAALRYQRELDEQLAIVRARQIQTLVKTMSDEEQKYNAALKRKYNIA